MLRDRLWAMGLGVLLLLPSCYNPAHIYFDAFNPLPSKGWHWDEVQTFRPELSDSGYDSKMTLKLRITGAYRYSNLYLLVHTTAPNGKRETKQHNFNLQHPDGRWTGQATGEMIVFELPLQGGLPGALPGKWKVEIQQNMRDERLQHVTDIGLQIERGEKQY
jgi:gliding motility-associated lipoprotein GldH